MPATSFAERLKMPGLERVENLLILGSPTAIPRSRRPNPLAGKDEFIEMEPGTPIGNEPYSLAVGRLFHADPGVVALTSARARLLPAAGSRRTALVASNPGGSLPMLETFSRTSVANWNPAAIRRLPCSAINCRQANCGGACRRPTCSYGKAITTH